MEVTDVDERTAARFWPKVGRTGPIAIHRPDLGCCWIWTGSLFENGYGRFWTDGRNVKAHRWLWIETNGPVPDGLELDHFACDRRRCVNPSHVRPVTHLANMQRGVFALKKHCPKGHPYSAANTLMSNGRRNCKTCRADWQRRRRSRRRTS